MDLHLSFSRPHHSLTRRWLRPALALLTSATILLAAGLASALQVGDSGPEVLQLQQALVTAKFLTTTPTGTYGTLTEEAVRRFQIFRNLTVDGIAGPETIQELNRYLGGIQGPIPPVPQISCTELKKGCVGEGVQKVQLQLRSLNYYFGPTDGRFGEETEQSLRLFQRDAAIAETGTVTPLTQQTLNRWSASIPGVEQPNQTQKAYIVVIPLDRAVSLTEVKRWAKDATEENSRLGRYIQAGVFGDRNSAQRLADDLKSHGFDAHVRFVR